MNKLLPRYTVKLFEMLAVKVGSLLDSWCECSRVSASTDPSIIQAAIDLLTQCLSECLRKVWITRLHTERYIKKGRNKLSSREEKRM